MTKRKYTLANRLADVITLISVLSGSEHSFRKNSELNNVIRVKPQSVDVWEKIVEQHPEFFRFNGPKDHVALLIRSYFPEDGNPPRRRTMTVDETQKLIDVAIALHEKEIQRIQKNSHLVPIIAALFTLLGVILGIVVNSRANSTIKDKINSLDSSIHTIENKVDKLSH